MAKASTVEKWLSTLQDAEKAKGAPEWEDRCKVIKKKYLYDGSSSNRSRKYQIFWSNIQQLQSAIYAKPPKGVVNRRFRDPDPVGRIATQILERAVNFTLDTGGYDTTFKRVRDDYLLYARGVARVYYEPVYETANSLGEDIEDAEDIKGDGNDPAGGGIRNSGNSEGYAAGSGPGPRADKTTVTAQSEPVEEEGQTLEFENVKIRFVHRDDFRHDPARTWEEVTWAAFRAFMTKDELSERFGEDVSRDISFSLEGGDQDSGSSSDGSVPGGEDEGKKAAVWEIWDKTKDRVLWIARGHPDVLEEGPPYLELDGFFPCPCPAFGTLTNDSLVPVPDFVFYQDQIEEIDQLTSRIGSLSDSLKLVGFYPAGPQGEGAPEIERAFRPGFENKMIAVQSWAAFKEGGAGGVPVVFLPIEQVGKIVEGCIKLRQQLVQDVYQIMGLSDIMRGATDPQETEGAQQLKAQFGGVRLRDKQGEIARFCRDITRLVAQIISVHCSPQTVMKMTDTKLPSAQDVMMADMQYKQQVQQMVQQYQMAAQQGQMSAPAQQPVPGSPLAGAGPGQQPQQSNVPPPPQPPPPPDLGPTQEDVFGLLRDNVQRLFRIDIEAESTVVGDESKEKQDRTQMIESATKFMEAWGPMVQANPLLAPLAGQLLMFGVRAFRIGRELEEVIEETAEKIEQKAQGGGGQSDPKAAAEQIKMQGTQLKAQAEIQKANISAQAAQAAAVIKLKAIQLQAQHKDQEAAASAGQSSVDHTHKVVQMHHQAALDAAARVHQQGIASQQAQQAAGQQSAQSQQDAGQQSAQSSQDAQTAQQAAAQSQEAAMNQAKMKPPKGGQ